jgi:hypothetical protein
MQAITRLSTLIPDATMPPNPHAKHGPDGSVWGEGFQVFV